MIVRHLAHAELISASSGRTVALLVLGLVLCGGLIVEHTSVKHGRFSLRLLAKPLAVFAAVAMAAVVAPVPGIALQPVQGSGLPDLISDPPFIWFNKHVTLPTGEQTRVMAFDGYLHNIGSGPLDVRGNPQVPGDVRQRVFDGQQWEFVATPRVQFETNDGHDHFHFMDAARYQLWNEARTEVIGDSSKVGFCLIDTERVDDRFESDYDIGVNNYCQRNTPDATELVMGITPGWRDTYEANVTFQWVDTSNVLPGRYWVSAEVDPLNQIVESNDDNNDAVFSMNKYAIDGYNARDLEVQASGAAIELKADGYGVVGRRAFVIEQGPANGALDVPIGVDLLDSDTITYTPNPGFTGTDTFSYYAHDTTSPYPFEPRIVEVAIEVEVEVASTNGTDVAASTVELLVDDYEELETFADVEIAVTAANSSDAIFYAGGLPPGLTISPAGLISGIATVPGDYDATVVAWIDGAETRITQTFLVQQGERQSLQAINDMWTTSSLLVRQRLGTGTRGATYEGSGTPAGTSIDSGVPQLSGTPEEIGTFVIEVRELVDGEVVDTIELTWTVLPSTKPAFAL